MKIAIFHNYMDNIGGAEMVTLILARELKADVYTTVVNKEHIKRMGFDLEVKSIGWIPKNAPFRQQLASLRFRFLNLSGSYDYYIIAGDWAISGAVKNKPNLWYVHSPIREIWDMYDYVRETMLPKRLTPWLARYLFDIWVHYNRYLNRKHVKHVTTLICNSQNVANRVETYLKRTNATVIHPPTDTTAFNFENPGDYWLSVNRLVAPKRIEMQLEAFNMMPDKKLIIVGTYENASHFLEYKHFLEKMMPSNVTLCSHVTFGDLTELYAHCRGFITTAQDEDFGLTAVEAMASGKPVIAPNEGGYKETVVDGETGVLIDDITALKLKNAVVSIDPHVSTYKDSCQDRAQVFDTNVFVQKIKHEIGI